VSRSARKRLVESHAVCRALEMEVAEQSGCHIVGNMFDRLRVSESAQFLYFNFGDLQYRFPYSRHFLMFMFTSTG